MSHAHRMRVQNNALNKYMSQIYDESYEGIPSLIRTEDSLTKNNK